MNLAPLSFGLWGLYVFNWKLHCAPRLRIYRIFSYSHPTTVELCWIWSLWDIERITPKKAWLQILPSYFWSTPARHTIAYIACVESSLRGLEKMQGRCPNETAQFAGETAQFTGETAFCFFGFRGWLSMGLSLFEGTSWEIIVLN